MPEEENIKRMLNSALRGMNTKNYKKQAEKQQRIKREKDSIKYAKIAIWVSCIGIVVAIIIALFSYYIISNT